MAINTLSTIADFPLNKRGDVLRINHNESSGRQTIDIRRWYTGDDDELHPTPKGVNIPLEEVNNVVNALTKFIETANGTAAKPAASVKKPVKKTTKTSTR